MGHIYIENRKRPDGSLSIRHVAEWKDRTGKRAAKRFGTRTEARKFLAGIEADSASPFRLGGRQMTVADLSPLYIKSLEDRHERDENCSRGHLQGLSGHLKNHILSAKYGIATVKLTDLSAGVVHDFVSRMRRPVGRKAGVSAPQARKILTTLRSMCAFAVSRDIMSDNPAKGLRVRASRAENHKRIQPPTAEQVKALLDAADPEFRLFILVAASTGLRSSEQRALRWRDVNLKKSEIRVERAVDRFGQFHPPKSRAGTRKVPISSALANELRQHRLKSEFSHDDDLVFCNRAGGVLHHANILARRWQPLCENVGIRYRWHDLRHYAASSWIEADIPLVRISKYLGHSSIAMTANTYGHLLSTDGDRDAIESVAASLC